MIPENPTCDDARTLLETVGGPIKSISATIDPDKREILVSIEPVPLPGFFNCYCMLRPGRVTVVLTCLRSGVRLESGVPFHKDSLMTRSFNHPSINESYTTIFNFDATCSRAA